MDAHPMALVRVCRTCGESKPLTSEFWYPKRGYRDGYPPHCKACQKAWAHAYKAAQVAKRGGKPRRQPRWTGDIEEWECRTAGCGWRARSEFYFNKNGTPRPLCKRCHNVATIEGQRRPGQRERIAERERERVRKQDPGRWIRRTEREDRLARGVRLCTGCQREFPFKEFQPTVKKPNGSRSRCHKCRNEQARVYARKAYELDRDRVRGYAHARHARIRGATVSDLTDAEWKRIRRAYEDRCGFCGRQCHTRSDIDEAKLTKEHDVPVSRGGWHTASNVFPACYGCNSAKQDRTADEWAAQSGPTLDRGPHPFHQSPLGLALPKRVKPRKPFPIPDGWNRLVLACDECRVGNDPLCDVCRRRVQRWQTGAKVRKRAPRFDADGAELHLCGDPDCPVGWQPADAFYRSTRGGLRSRCKACTSRRSAERHRSGV